MLTPLNLICFGYLPWSYLWKRNQSMVAQIAKFEYIQKVIFVNPILSLKNLWNRKNGSSPGPTRWHPGLLPTNVSANIWVYTPYRFLPFKGIFPKLKKLEDHFFYQVIRKLNRHQPYILLINDPIKSPDGILQNLLKHSELSIFDFSDDFMEYFTSRQNAMRSRCRKNISRYAGASDLVLAVNQHLKDKYRHVNQNIHVLKNATNFDNFNRPSFARVDCLEKIKNRNAPIIGYTGGIKKVRFDFILLDIVIKNKPDWQFVFIGDAERIFRERYGKFDNVHLFPAVEYQNLPDCLNYFDLAFIPFKRNEHTKGNDLLKVYDYLAMGKPVVSTYIGSMKELKDVVFLADTYSEFIDNMERALSLGNRDHAAARKSVARKNSWPYRIQELDSLIKSIGGKE